MVLGRLVGAVLLVGAGAVAVTAVIAAPHLLKAARPLVREGLRRSISIYDRARSAAAEFVEDVEDLVAEVRADVADPARGPRPAPTPDSKSA